MEDRSSAAATGSTNKRGRCIMERELSKEEQSVVKLMKDAIRHKPGMNLEGIHRTYRGRPGCGCGCNGTYSMNPITLGKRAAEAAEAIRSGEKPEMTRCSLEDGWCLSLESDKRYLWIYFREECQAFAFVGRALLGEKR